MFLCVLKPSEIVFDKDNLHSDILAIIRSPLLATELSPLSNRDNEWSRQLAMHYIEKHIGVKKFEEYPKPLQAGLMNKKQEELVLETMGGFYSYMERIMRIDIIL